tara:strand:- start:189 stop:401 length:213 start_codon:yes stop_codon:yes gene_type:complete
MVKAKRKTIGKYRLYVNDDGIRFTTNKTFMTKTKATNWIKRQGNERNEVGTFSRHDFKIQKIKKLVKRGK